MSEMERYNDRLQADNDSLMYGGGRGGQFGNMRGHTRGGNNFRGRGGGGWGHGDMSLPPPAPPGLPPDVQESVNLSGIRIVGILNDQKTLFLRIDGTKNINYFNNPPFIVIYRFLSNI